MPDNQDRLDTVITDFISREALPGGFKTIIRNHYLKIAARLAECHQSKARTVFIGINGSQGSGKTTLAACFHVLLARLYGLHVAVLSIDDLYLARADRLALARRIHPLLSTRGVPGTHDVALGLQLFDQLSSAGPKDVTSMPRFDKATDDRLPEAEWNRFTGRADIVILEGWCIGVGPQTTAMLQSPINELERTEDPDGIWRSYVNDQLSSVYKPLFNRLDKLIFLQIPGFECAFGWRMTQEKKLWVKQDDKKPDHAKLLSPEALHRFMAHYERLSRHALGTLPALADIVIQIDNNHNVTGVDGKNTLGADTNS